jgi:signal transduction histidine kinase
MVLGFIFVILITVSVLEAMIINIVRVNYYRNLEASLYNQVKVSCELYTRYFSDASLNDNVLNNVDSFWRQTDAQVEILDPEGRVLMDSIGYMPQDNARMPDVEAALKNGRGAWDGKVPYDSAGVMAVSNALVVDGRTVGVLRFITTLREVDNDVKEVSSIFIVIGLVVTAVSVLLSFLLAGSMVNPLKKVTEVAAKMASGDFAIRNEIKNNDEIGKLSNTLNYMADEIVKRDRLKNEFISSVSHELRTPLTSIKGWAVTLMEVGPEDKELFREGLEIIEKENDRLTLMVEELLDFSRLVADKIRIQKESVRPEELVAMVGRQLGPRAVKEGLNFEVVTEGDLPDIYTDGNRLKQVFINILDNAFRFTEAGGSVLLKAEASGGEVVFTVSDTGCGIPADELPKVKEKFFKGRNSKSGNGIGLSICDEIVKLMDGRMAIYSAAGKGTKVVIRLPAAPGGMSA